ncbi:MAG: EAL domain-containing protein [Gammaproteobacteria bacterium]|nr:EAL domain-containing protein [Gammaproteobacteria bacterium]
MIKPIFAPANALLRRMGYTGKFTLLWLLSMAALTVVVYSLFISLERIIQPSQRELEGIVLIEPVARTIQATQLHRGMAAAAYGGDEGLRARQAAQTSVVAATFRAMEKKLPPGLTSTPHFRQIEAAWERLRQHGTEWGMEDNFAAHTDLIRQLQSFKVAVADDYLLILDPEIASYYLLYTTINTLPHALEHLGQIRAYGSGVLASRELSDRQRLQLHTQMAELDSTLNELQEDLAKTARHNAAIGDSLRSTLAEINRSAQRITVLVKGDLLTGRLTTPAELFLEMATAEIDNGYRQMVDILLPTAGALIEQRITRARNTLYKNSGLALLALLVVVYFTVSIYHGIINNIHLLAQAARAFASGELATRARLHTHDELSVVADSFNEMADGFTAMLAARRHAEELLLKEAHKNKTLLRAASDGIHILDLEGNVLQVNDAFCQMLGYTAQQLEGMNVAEFDAQWDAAQIRENIKRLGDSAVTLETRHCRHDGSIIDVDVSIVKVDVDGETLIYCSSRDVTERKRAVRALTENQQKLNAVIETALDAVVQMSATGVISGWNTQAEKIFGWPREQIVGRTLSETIIPPQYRAAHAQGLKRFLASGEGYVLSSRVELVGLHRDGHEFPVELSITAVNTAGEYEFNGFIRDISAQKRSEQLIWNQANFDSLTGLPNRNMFHDRLAQNIRKAQRTGLKTALLIIDLDKFKEVNDTLGHGMGDLLLQEAARRICASVRQSDTVARLGGDEFTVILGELEDVGRIERVAETILHNLTEPFRLGDEVAYVSASIGITLHPDDTSEVDDLLKNADQAMYAAKNEGRNRFSYFTLSMQQAAQVRLRLTNELRGALAASQFTLQYQPIVELATGRITKAEALLRWQHPQMGIVSPAQFIPLAEETGLIVGIGDWVFREATRQVEQWNSLYNADLQISVNVSPVQLSRAFGSPYQAWFDYLRELGLPGENVVIEITEGLLLDADPEVTGKLLEFRDAGIQAAIDDFGTGYSSLSYLKKFDIDYLKIDQSFVRNLVSDANDMALSEAIIVMAHKLGLKVIAEGVETEAQRQLLAAADCDYVQGYLLSRPVSADEFTQLLKTQAGGGPLR